MALVTNTAMQRIREEIVDRHDLLLIMLFGEDALPPAMVARLRAKKYTWPARFTPGPQDAFEFGMLAAKFQRTGTRVPLTFAEYRKAKAANPIALTAEERAAVESIKRDVIARIKGLGDKVNATTGEVISAADKALRRKLDALVTEELRAGIVRRQTLKEVAQRLRDSTKDYATDFLRIAATELNNAYQEGRLHTIKRANKGKDPLVFKQPRPDACQECKDAYLVPGTNRPKVFRLSELLKNGSNVGRSHADREAVLESHHPWCRCELHELPAGFDLNDEGAMIYQGLP